MNRSKREFTKKDLPDTRWRLFKDRFVFEWGKLFKTGLILLIFCLPLAALSLVKDIEIVAVFSEQAKGNLSAEEAKALVNSTTALFDLLSVVAFPLFSVGLAGVMVIIKRLAWLEPVFFKFDFFDGVKSNSPIIIVTFTVFGLLSYFASFALGRYKSFIISVIPVGFVLVVFLPVLLYTVSLTTVYKLKFSETIKTAFSIYLRSVPQTLAAVALIIGMAAITLIRSILLKYIAFSVLILFALPSALLGWFLVSCRQFDKFINARQFPELVDKGLYKGE